MIDMRHKPYHLPQINAPADIVIKKLKEEGVDYDYVRVNPNDLNTSQGFTFSDGVYNAELDDKNPIWLDEDNNVLDGHHRWVKSLSNNDLIVAVRIKMNNKDACRLLNKIQDIFEYDEQLKMEEVVAQDVINASQGYTAESQFLKSLEEDNAGIQAEKPSKNDQILIGYRKEPIRQNSVIGNFFTLTPMEGFSKFQIDFENLLDTNDLGIHYKDGQVPAEVLAKVWFPNINFEKLSEEYNTPSINLKNKAIAEKAIRLGYDGIKYGDTLVQGLK
jgi:hypothetical protein